MPLMVVEYKPRVSQDLQDALPHITFLSKAFQTADCDYSSISRMPLSTLQSLEALKEVDGINLADLEMFWGILVVLG